MLENIVNSMSLKTKLKIIKVVKTIVIATLVFWTLVIVGAVHQSAQQSKQYDAEYQQMLIEIQKASNGGK